MLRENLRDEKIHQNYINSYILNEITNLNDKDKRNHELKMSLNSTKQLKKSDTTQMSIDQINKFNIVHTCTSKQNNSDSNNHINQIIVDEENSPGNSNSTNKLMDNFTHETIKPENSEILELPCGNIIKKTNNFIVLIDMDNTLVNWDSQFIKVMGELHPEVPLVPYSDREHWKIEMNYPSNHRKKVASVTNNPNFWLGMKPMPGGVEAVKEMEAYGHKVFVVSTPDTIHTPRCAMEKYLWIEKYFGPDWKKKLILTNDKTLIRGNILLDDKPTATVGSMKPTWRHILFSQPYNKDDKEGRIRLENWSEWRSAFKNLEISQNEIKECD